MAVLPPGIRFFLSFSRDQWFRALVLVLTYLLYCSFHLSRKPITIVKGELHKHCSEPHEIEPHSYKEFVILKPSTENAVQNASRCGWAPFDKQNYKQLLGALDYSFLCAYAVGMFLSGMIGERLPLRYFLSSGMVASGFFTALFGLGYFYNIHNLTYYIIIQARLMVWCRPLDGQVWSPVSGTGLGKGGEVSSWECGIRTHLLEIFWGP